MRRHLLLPLLAGTLLVPALALGATPQERAERILERTPGRMTASISCGSPARRVEVGATQRIRAASSLKVAVALAVMRRERLSARDAGRDADMRAMIMASDNAAANRLIARAGGLKRVEAFMHALGMHDTNLDVPYGVGLNTMAKATTARDMRRLADALLLLSARGRGPLQHLQLSRPQAQVLVGLMERTTHASLMGGIPDIRIAHKSGWLDTVENDLVIVRLPGRQACAVGLMSEGVGASAARTAGFALTREVIARLAPVAR